MVRCAGMSRGCGTCRKRRIKCDEKIPSCSQCSRGGRSCPGAVDGRIFLLAQRDNPRKYSRKLEALSPKTKKKGNINEHKSSVYFYQDNLDLERIKPGQNDGYDQHIKSDLCFVTSPTATTVNEKQLISKFISFFAKSAANETKAKNWMSMLPTMLDNGSRIELRSSVLAVALALYSKTCQDTCSEIEAQKLYIIGLRQQRVKMVLASHSAERIIPKVEDVAMAALLAYYEVISPTTERAYFQHILGAKALLEMIGPQSCQRGYFHQLFQLVRVYMVHISIATRLPTKFASDGWNEIPFRYVERTTCDCIMDILLQLPQIWLLPNNQGEAQQTSDFKFYESITQLQSVWTKLQNNYHVTALNINGIYQDHMLINGIDICDFVPGYFTIPNSEGAIATAFYSLAWIIIIEEIRKEFLTVDIYERLLLSHCDSVLRASHFIEDFDDGCGFIRLVFPLRSVALLSPSPMQQDYAKYRLQRWRVKKGLGGICSLAMSANTDILSL